MQSRSVPSHVLTFAVALAAGAFVACAAPRTGETTVTAADLPAAKESAPAPEAERPAGQLACKATSIHDGTNELFLEWNGSAARGTLRRTAPSGMVSSQPVKAERYKDMIIADEPSSADLVDHAATVRTHEGKTYMRLGTGGSWTRCD